MSNHLHRLLCVLVASLVLDAAAEEVLYAASVRSPLNNDAHLVVGNLYKVDIGSGVFSLVAPMRVHGTSPVGVTGLADHPQTQALYGVTAESSPNHPSSLVLIHAADGDTTLIGSLRAAGTDIAFDPAGRLFVWLRETGQVATVDLETGAATALGPRGRSGPTGGIAIDANGRGYVASAGATGTLDTFDIRTGAITRGPAITGAPFPGGINSLAVSPSGALFAANTNLGSPANVVLVRIDLATGAVTQIGPLPNDTDALVFAQGPGAGPNLQPAWIAAGVLALLALALGVAILIRNR